MLDHVHQIVRVLLQVALLERGNALREFLLLSGIKGVGRHEQDVRHVVQAEALALLERLAELGILAPEVGDGETVAVQAVPHALADQTAVLALPQDVVEAGDGLLQVAG